MLAQLIAIIVGILVGAVCLWAGMKITKVDGTFVAMLLISTATALVGAIPGIGLILGTVVMFVLICKLTDAEFWPDAVLMVVVSRAVAVFAAIGLGALFANAS